MFDLVTGKTGHIPNHNAVPLLITSMAEAVVITAAVAVPLLFLADRVPEVPSIIAFVAAAPPPPPPPPPAARAAATQQKAVATSGPSLPSEAPSEIRPEPASLPIDDGVPGGVEGGIPGGIVGDVAGAIVEAPPPPPPPPAPPAAPPRPVRIGGDMTAPALLTRIEPMYPPIAVAANIQGVVILEATVTTAGKVADVRVLRSVHPLVDVEALRAVRQWQYSPFMFNGQPCPFILTVTLSFALKPAALPGRTS